MLMTIICINNMGNRNGMLNNLKKINENNIIIILVVLTISFSLIYDKISQHVLNLAFFISIVYFFIRKNPFNNKLLLFPLLLIIFSFFEILWSKSFQGIDYNNINNEYYKSAKRLMVCSVILFHFISNGFLADRKTLVFCKFIALLSYLYISILGVFDYVNNGERISFGISATMGGYIYLVQALFTLYIVSIWEARFANFLLVLLSIFTLCIILMTGTRALIIVYPFCIFFLFLKSHIINLKMVVAFFAIIIIGISVNLIPSSIITYRIDTTLNEISKYKDGEVNSSLGARFSLWKAGLDIIQDNPYSISADKRNELAKNYIKEKQYSNPEALRAIEFHLHNDIINMGSLQGWFSILMLLSFYISIIYYPLKITKNILVTLLIALPIIVLGLTDTLLIYGKFVYMHMCCMILYLCYSKNAIKHS